MKGEIRRSAFIGVAISLASNDRPYCPCWRQMMSMAWALNVTEQKVRCGRHHRKCAGPPCIPVHTSRAAALIGGRRHQRHAIAERKHPAQNPGHVVLRSITVRMRFEDDGRRHKLRRAMSSSMLSEHLHLVAFDIHAQTGRAAQSCASSGTVRVSKHSSVEPDKQSGSGPFRVESTEVKLV